MKTPWFRATAWCYRPVSWQGWVCVMLFALFCAEVFAAVDRHSHSASDTLFGVFPYLVPAFLLLDWLAARKSDA